MMPSDIVPVYENVSTAYLLAPTKLVGVIDGCPLPEIAAKLLRQAAPPATVKTAIVVFSYETLEIRQRCVEALRNEGFTNIESIDPRSVKLSSSIYDLPLNCAVGEPVFVNCTTDYVDPFETYTMYVIQKRENGWQIIETLQHPLNALSKYPSARNVVIYKNSLNAIKAEVRKLFPNLKLHFSSEISPIFHVKFIRNQVNNGNLNGYRVLPYCNAKLRICFANKVDDISLTDRVPPFAIQKEIDVGDAPFVEVYTGSIGLNPSMSKMKTFMFKNKVFRKVLVTVKVDKSLIPSVELATASTYRPRDRQTPVVYSARIVEKCVYSLTAVFEDHVSSEGAFMTTAAVFNHIEKASAASAIKDIFFVYTAENTVSQLQEFCNFCAETEVYPPKFIFNDSVHLSFVLDRAGVSIKPGQKVTTMTPNVVYVVQRDGELLQILDTYLPQNYDISEHDVDTVIVENEENVFTQTDLEYLRLKYYPRAVIVLPGIGKLEQPISKFFWSRVNGTDYGGNFFNNFGHFEFHIEGDGVAETVSTRFKAIPYTVTADVKVNNATTLNVILFRSAAYFESLRKFDVPNGAKAVRFTIHIESVWDMTVAMDVIDETEVTQQPKKVKPVKNPEHSNPKTSIVNLVVQFGIKSETISLTNRVTPFTVSKEVDVGDASEVTVRAVSHGKVDYPAAVKTLKFKKSAFRKVSITVQVDQHCATELSLRTASTYKATPQPIETGDSLDTALSQLILDPPSTTVLTFTSDNRVLIEANKTYTGDKEIPAYVRLQSGRAPEVGQKAFDALKKHPGSVFYDVTRLLAAGFDPDHPDPSWHFKTTRDADGKVLVHGDDDVVTLPIVLFGMIVKCTLIYIKQHQKPDVPILRIRLPAGCVISDADLKTISPLIRIELILL